MTIKINIKAPNQDHVNCTWCGHLWSTPFTGSAKCPVCKKAKLCPGCNGYITPSGMGAHRRSTWCTSATAKTKMMDAGMVSAPWWIASLAIDAAKEVGDDTMAVSAGTHRAEYGWNKGNIENQTWVAGWVASLVHPKDLHKFQWNNRKEIVSVIGLMAQQEDLRPIWNVAASMELGTMELIAMVLEAKNEK